VNLKHIEKVHPKEVLINGKEIPVSESSRARIITEIEFILGNKKSSFSLKELFVLKNQKLILIP
jgi:hypothetical protein